MDPLRSSVSTSTGAGISTSASRDIGGGGFFAGFTGGDLSELHVASPAEPLRQRLSSRTRGG